MFERIIAEAVTTPWAINRSYLPVVRNVLSGRAGGERPSAEGIAEIRAARRSAEAQRRVTFQHVAKTLGCALAFDDDDVEPTDRMLVFRASAVGGSTRGPSIAVIPIYGAILHRSFDAISGATSTDVIGAMLQMAMDDDEIDSILLDVASPGGTVVGVPELAGKILAARKEKDIVSIVNGEMHSAGYWLGSQANQIVAIPSAYLGSVGVWMLSWDLSEHLANEGVKPNFVYSGDNKIEDGRFWEPLSKDARAHLQEQVDEVAAKFDAAIAKGRSNGDRRVSVAEVKKTYGQGRVFGTKDALERGMIDRLGSLEDVLGSMLKTAARRKSGTSAAGETSLRMSLAADEPVPPARVAAAPRADDDTVDPDENGDCPDGYEKGDDGMCHLVANAASAASQAAADRDAIELELARD